MGCSCILDVRVPQNSASIRGSDVRVLYWNRKHWAMMITMVAWTNFAKPPLPSLHYQLSKSWTMSCARHSDCGKSSLEILQRKPQSFSQIYTLESTRMISSYLISITGPRVENKVGTEYGIALEHLTGCSPPSAIARSSSKNVTQHFLLWGGKGVPERGLLLRNLHTLRSNPVAINFRRLFCPYGW